MNRETAWQMLQINVEAVVQLSLFFEGMQKRNFGRILNNDSISGGLPSQGIALYGSIKAFLDNFTAVLDRELENHGFV